MQKAGSPRLDVHHIDANRLTLHGRKSSIQVSNEFRARCHGACRAAFWGEDSIEYTRLPVLRIEAGWSRPVWVNTRPNVHRPLFTPDARRVDMCRVTPNLFAARLLPGEASLRLN